MYINGYHVINKFGFDYVRIFYHDVVNGYFFTKDNVKFIQSRYKQSVLKYIDDDFKFEGKYEFILQYPEETEIRWTQATSILDKVQNTNCEILTKDKQYRFYGLSVSADESRTFLDGSPGDGTDNWWFAIGSFTKYDGKISIPGPCSSSECVEVTHLSLYIRFTNLTQINKFPPIPKFCTKQYCNVLFRIIFPKQFLLILISC